MIESAIGATFAAQKQESPDAKVSCPPAVVESSRLIGIANLRQFCYLRRKSVISNSAKVGRLNEYANKRYSHIAINSG